MPLDVWQSETDRAALKRLDEAGFAGAFMRRWATYCKDHAETARLIAAGAPNPSAEWETFCQRWRIRFPA
ncbi:MULTISPECIES: transcriptional regulator domain-containing protein [Acetobacter]|uniref:Transcriptional regulator-like domain-containing protein n=2 Tax=Acetobacter TaxID=434 RepID=A0AAN1PFJ2_9PROT|nr:MULTISPECIES: DUF6499 domain-containing protein [Acetobacter]ASL41400.1 hypothetical protein CBI36_14090 [Acetobacter oryzifermentans]AXM99278.1 hypothetical protein CJF59_00845 [Acetobacter pomorum]KAA8391331.1 hypothetical protein FKW22_14915 [Acetobacter sp. DmW_125124]KAA8393664.1 hypothetical protein FKW19_13955 [Acetobacter sp. DmW_125128]KAA8395157.1 hypothetical protein FKW20_12140 [Acetobacter sp. DmW_125127]